VRLPSRRVARCPIPPLCTQRRKNACRAGYLLVGSADVDPVGTVRTQNPVSMDVSMRGQTVHEAPPEYMHIPNVMYALTVAIYLF